jgi:hypothetical protein
MMRLNVIRIFFDRGSKSRRRLSRLPGRQQIEAPLVKRLGGRDVGRGLGSV